MLKCEDAYTAAGVELYVDVFQPRDSWEHLSQFAARARRASLASRSACVNRPSTESETAPARPERVYNVILKINRNNIHYYCLYKVIGLVQDLRKCLSTNEKVNKSET